MLPLEHSAILSTFIKLPVVIKTFVLSVFEWPFYTGFTVIEKAINDVENACFKNIELNLQSLTIMCKLKSVPDDTCNLGLHCLSMYRFLNLFFMGFFDND